jgi:hypothetical protein
MDEEETFEQLFMTDGNMEIMGYYIQPILPTPDRDSSDASPAEAIEKAIGRDKLYGLTGKSCARPAIYWEGGDNYQDIFKRFMEEGLGVGHKSSHS